MNCFCYLRVSGPSQTKGDGFLRQFKAIRKYCAANDLKIVRIFRERGVSGKTDLEDRPALSDLFEALEEDGVRVVVIEKLDRLARLLMVQETIVADMARKELTLLSALEPDLCSDDPTRVLIRQILGAFAQYEAAILVLKLRAARERKTARGERGTGRHAFGEKIGEKIILDRILDLRFGGATFQAIASHLNGSNFRSRTGAKWRASTVAKIVAREEAKNACKTT